MARRRRRRADRNGSGEERGEGTAELLIGCEQKMAGCRNRKEEKKRRRKKKKREKEPKKRGWRKRVEEKKSGLGGGASHGCTAPLLIVLLIGCKE